MKIGNRIDRFNDITGLELVNQGWTEVIISGLGFSYDTDDEIIKWLKLQKIDVDYEVRWLSSLAYYFRRSEDAMAFKIGWL